MFERLIYLPNHIFSFVKLAIAPYDLNVEYVFAYPQSFFEISHLVGFVIITGLCIFSFLFYGHYKEIFFGIWWFLITLFPVYNIIEIFNPFAERYPYIPVIGFCLVIPIILSSTFSRALNNKKAVNTATLLVVILILSGYMTITIARNRDWRDGLTLWSKTVMQSPDSGVAKGSLGRAYQDQGLIDKAIAEYETAVKIMPNHFRAYYNLGVVYDQQGGFDQAEANLKSQLRLIRDLQLLIII